MSATEFATSNILAPVARRESLLRRLLRNPMGAVSMALLFLVAVLAIFGPMLAPMDPNFSDARDILSPPGAEHLLGTDIAGRDVWSRLLTAAQLTVAAALLCVIVSLVVGVPTGLLAGYYGGVFDRISGWGSELLMSLPGIIVLLAVRAALGPSVWIAMAMLGFLVSPTYFRLVRSAVRNVRGELYVDAARVSGLSDRRIIARHIVYVVRAPIIIQTAMILGLAIAVQSGLQFLGLGDALSITWGAMLGQGFEVLYRAPLLILWPALAIGATVGAAVLFANALRDALEDSASGASGNGRPRQNRTQTGMATVLAEQPAHNSAEDLPADAILRVSQLQIAFEQKDGSFKKVIDGVSLAVRAGEVVGLVGESGSGKTQTAFAILGLLAPEARVLGGTIVVDGETTVEDGDVDAKRLSRMRGRRISYIPQEPMSNLDPNFTIGAQLTRPMVKVLGISRTEAKERALALLARVGIVDPEKTFASHPHEISGGMAQRVLIAGAVSCEPDLIIADEPTTALDVTVQAEVLDLLRGMKDELGVGILLVTHNFGVVADLADRVVVMRHGQIVETGDVRRILNNPRERYTQVLIGSMIRGREPMTMLTKEA